MIDQLNVIAYNQLFCYMSLVCDNNVCDQIMDRMALM
jgi:hypothetical protein